jgi:hypothetical protein
MPILAKGPFPKPSTTYRDESYKRSTTIEEYRALKSMPKGDEALKLLRSIGMTVKPIMIKHHWSLPLLVEIYPKQESLLGFNVNRGQKIALRLRQASNHQDFLDEESIVETMLHELAHNLRGPHDEVFFQHLDMLTMEWYELRRSGTSLLAGQGFLSEGVKLGNSNGRYIDPVRARQKAVEMAENRRRLQEVMSSSGGSRLGGGGVTPVSSAAARAEAAERRRNITRNCPSSSTKETQIAAQEQEAQELLHGIQVITIDDNDDDDDDIVTELPTPTIKPEEESSGEDEVIIVDVKKAPKRTKLTTESTPSLLVKQTRDAAALRVNLLDGSSNLRDFRQGPGRNSSSRSHTVASSGDITHQSKAWNCQQCTLRNSQSSLECQACNSIRPGLEYWICSHCHHRMLGDYAQYWCCTKCSQMKTA